MGEGKEKREHVTSHDRLIPSRLAHCSFVENVVIRHYSKDDTSNYIWKYPLAAILSWELFEEIHRVIHY